MLGRKLNSTVTSIVCATAVFSSPAAHADMGSAPQGVPGVHVSIEGGFLFQSSDGIVGHGISTTAAPLVVQDILVSPENGWFGGITVGDTSASPVISGLPFHRFEGYFLFGNADDSRSDTAPPLAGTSLNTVDGALPIGPDGTSGSSSAERDTYEGGLRLEDDVIVSATQGYTWGVTAFVRLNDETVQSSVVGCCVLHRQGEVETWMYGVLVTFEPEVKLTPGVTLVARIGAGVYGYDGDGDFRSFSTGLPPPDIFAAQVSDSESGIGFRGQLGAGIKFALANNMNLEAFAEADYFSDVGTANMPTNGAVTGPASVGNEDLWELRTGARLSIGFAN